MPTVLLAEDSAAIRELLRLRLGFAGYDVLEAADGAGCARGLPGL